MPAMTNYKCQLIYDQCYLSATKQTIFHNSKGYVHQIIGVVAVMLEEFLISDTVKAHISFLPRYDR